MVGVNRIQRSAAMYRLSIGGFGPASLGHAVVSLKDPSMANSDEQTATRYQRHILYIQMQLSQKTLLDYFQARDDNIDIPLSLRMFGHIVRGVKNVHEKGLIHRCVLYCHECERFPLLFNISTPY